MTPEQWRQAKELFAAARILETPAREHYIRSMCGGDQELQSEVLEMLEADSSPASFFDQPILPSLLTATVLNSGNGDMFEGREIGHYRLIRRIGRGGMGAVYLAERTDGFRKLVAFKLMQSGPDQEQLVRRFHNERQTLAVLDHPNIVRLLDGGTTAEGCPYLVMDYVDGQAIDTYCDSRKLGVRERLQLFREVCGAVQYAHQNLIVHRDLKPANILVTSDGVPKLLDFGIARLLKPEYLVLNAGLTRTRSQPHTPEYASPEQVKGLPITTASDIYSLGIVLCKLLTGRLPYVLHSHTAGELETAICELGPQMPSSQLSGHVERQYTHYRFSGDLDNIVSMTLRKEPQRRYASADQLSDDLRRHLEGLPVIARKPTFRYRAQKFCTRNLVGVTAAAVAVVMLTLTTVLALYNSRIAVREQVRAENRFEDLRQLASFVIFEFDDAIRSGPTEARRRLIPKALEYLDGLASEPGASSALQLELANAYIRVGDLQGNLYGANTGDAQGARASYRKAFELAKGSGDSKAANRASIRLADIHAAEGDRSEALRTYKEALARIDSTALVPQIEIQNKIGLVQLQAGDADGALATYRRALALAESGIDPKDLRESMRRIAYGNERVGFAMTLTGRVPEGIERLKAALQGYREQAAETPAIARDLANTYVQLGDAYSRERQPADAIRAYSDGLALISKLALGDPGNAQYLRDQHITLGRLADAELAAGNRVAARKYTQDCLRILRPLVARGTASVYDLQQFSWLLLTTPFTDLHDSRAALDSALRAAELTKRSDPAILDTLARAYFAAGEHSAAVHSEEEALQLIKGASALRAELEANLLEFRSATHTRARSDGDNQ